MSQKNLDANRFSLQFVAENEGLLRDYLHGQGISKTTLTAIKYEGGEITVNGKEQNVRFLLQPKDVVTVVFPPEVPSKGLLPEQGNINIVYEDQAILIVDKPANQSTIPSRNHPSQTLANFVCGKFEAEGLPATVHVVTRLDTDTSGVICIAKNRHVHHLLSEQMRNKTFQRTYQAFVEGFVEPSTISIEQPIGRKENSIIERTVRPDGQYARTELTVLHHCRYAGKEFTVVELSLQTGRTHQIRVHLQWLGHPLIGDDLYGGHRQWLDRQALHCSSLQFLHPLSGMPVHFTSPLPPDMSRLLEQPK